jgi:hypothetical protein
LSAWKGWQRAPLNVCGIHRARLETEQDGQTTVTIRACALQAPAARSAQVTQPFVLVASLLHPPADLTALLLPSASPVGLSRGPLARVALAKWQTAHILCLLGLARGASGGAHIPSRPGEMPENTQGIAASSRQTQRSHIPSLLAFVRRHVAPDAEGPYPLSPEARPQACRAEPIPAPTLPKCRKISRESQQAHARRRGPISPRS